MTTIDYAPLTAPVSSAEISVFKAESRSSGQPWARYPIGAPFVLAIVLISLFALGPCLVGLLLLISILVALKSQEPILDKLLGLGIFIFAGVGVTYFGRNLYNDTMPARSTWTRWLQLSKFARANGMFYSPSTPSQTYPGSVFTAGSEGQVHDHLYRNDGRFLDIGNYEYITGSGKSRSAQHWGFLALKLDRALPNMVLDARRNNTPAGTTDLPENFAADQRLSLGGDFDKYFTLYCPKEYERDARSVFTPDLMALLIDSSQRFGVEIVDDWMFVYSANNLNVTDIPTLDRLFRIVDTVGAKTATQTATKTERDADDGAHGLSTRVVTSKGERSTRRRSVLSSIVLSGLVITSIFLVMVKIMGWWN